MEDHKESQNDLSISSDKLDDLVIKQLKDVTVEDDCIYGYFEHLDVFNKITMLMKEQGYSFSVRDSETRPRRPLTTGKKEHPKQEGPNTVFFEQKVMNIKFFGNPYTVDKMTHYTCVYGRRYYKCRAKSKKTEVTSSNPRPRPCVMSKKIGCLAKMTLKKVTVYPDYVLEAIKLWKKKKQIVSTLRYDLNHNPDNVATMCRYYVCITLQSVHNHPSILAEKSFKLEKKKTAKKSSCQEKEESEGDLVTLYSYKDASRAFSSGDTSFFNTLVKIEPTSVTYSPINPVTFEVRGFEMEPVPEVDDTVTYQVETDIEHPLQNVQLTFKEKLKRLYTLSENCTNTSLLLRLISQLEQADSALVSDLGYDPTL